MEASWNDRTTGLTFAILNGVKREQEQHAAVMAILAFLLVALGSMTATVAILTDKTELIPPDFKQKGTLSNLCQDLSSPQGKVWTVALVISSILLMTSQCPFFLYRSWSPWHNWRDNPLVHSVFQSKGERLIRTVWNVVPNVGFILTGVLPCISGATGLQAVLPAVHDVAAPLSMLFCVAMETIQLGFGEKGFSFFFSTAATPLYGPLTGFQRVRVVVLTFAWIAGLIFVSVQGYLAFFTNESLSLALTSYFGEVVGLTLAFMMPAIQGLRYLLNQEEGNLIDEATALIKKIASVTPMVPQEDKAE